jgi:putative transcriptional regulator
MSKTITTISKARLRPLKRDKYGMTPRNYARLDAMTEEEVLAAARSDPDALPAEDRKPGSLGPARRAPLSRWIRLKLGLSQDEFAAAFRIPVGTLRDWEQHRREPDQAARAYLDVIAREPKAVRRALALADKDEATAKAKRENVRARAKPLG